MEKQYCIFDMDGTLVDSMGFWRTLGWDYLVSLGVQPTVPQLEQTRSMTMPEAAAYFMELYAIPGPPERIVRAMEEVMEYHYLTDVPLKPGVEAYLASLKKRGAALCVATATAEPLAHACFRRLGIDGYFDFVLSCETVGRSKTHPEIYLAAARRLGVPKEKTVVFEDALYAAETAKRAGFYVVGVYDEVQKHHWDRLNSLCDRCIRSWEELL